MCRAIYVHIDIALRRASQVVAAKHLAVDVHIVGMIGFSTTANFDVHRAIDDSGNSSDSRVRIEISVSVGFSEAMSAAIHVAVDGAVEEVDVGHIG